jgi:heme O synthase-like polyprenyltransferase
MHFWIEMYIEALLYKTHIMIHFLSPNMNFDGLILLIIAIMIGPAIVLAILGFILSKKNKKAAKVMFILAAVYVIISFGACGAMVL